MLGRRRLRGGAEEGESGELGYWGIEDVRGDVRSGRF